MTTVSTAGSGLALTPGIVACTSLGADPGSGVRVFVGPDLASARANETFRLN
jgi:hypothetical protein